MTTSNILGIEIFCIYKFGSMVRYENWNLLMIALESLFILFSRSLLILQVSSCHLCIGWEYFLLIYLGKRYEKV